MKMLTLAAALAATSLSAALPAQETSAPAPPPQLTLEQATLLRCSAAFAIVAAEQDRQTEAALAFPPLKERGREYFVRSGARLMDELQLSREGVQALFAAEAEKLQPSAGERRVDAVMEPCLLSLEASGL